MSAYPLQYGIIRQLIAYSITVFLNPPWLRHLYQLKAYNTWFAYTTYRKKILFLKA